MIVQAIEFSLKHKLMVVLLFVAVCAAGVLAVLRIPIDAFPDISPNLVQVFAEVEGTAAEEVEQLVSRPVEVAMMGIPGVEKIRSTSSHGLSTVNVYFRDGVDIYLAHQLVAERIKHAEEEIPEAVNMPHGLEKGPIVSGMGKILSYYLESDQHDTTELRALQDWVIKRNIQTVPGVADVTSQGGHVRQYQIRVDPRKLLKYDLTLNDVADAVEDNNLNLGAGIIERGAEELMVRTLGLIADASDLEDVVVRAFAGTPVCVKDVASVRLGSAFRRGVTSLNGEKEVVVGDVYKTHGANSFEVINRIKARIREIGPTLPPGVEIVPYYDQSRLVRNSINTVRGALVAGMGLVCLVAFVFLGSVRNAVIVALSLPFSMLFGFFMMHRFGMPGDLISFGGVAIALGMIVDATIIMVEKIQSSAGRDGKGGTLSATILSAGEELGRPILFGTTIIALVFVPIFALGGVEGKMFRPLAFALVSTMMGSLVYALILAPAFYGFVLKRRKPGPSRPPGSSRFSACYRALLTAILPHRVPVVLGMLVLLGIGVWLFGRLGKEFVPSLQEGTVQVLAYMDPNISLAEIGRRTREVEHDILQVDGVKYTLANIGYGEVSPHVHHTNYACITVGLEPKGQWGTAETQEELVARIDHQLEKYTDASISFSQPIQHEVDGLIAGAGAAVVAKLFGADADVLEAKVGEIEAALATVPGVVDLRTEQFSGQAQVRIEIDSAEIARHGLTKYEVQDYVRTALAGKLVGQVFEDEKAFGIDVRLADGHRESIEAIRSLLVRIPAGYTVPLEQLAEIATVTGKRQVSREDTHRYISVQCNVRGRDVGGFVEEAQKAIAETVTLPPGYRLAWGGQFELQQAANKRLVFVIPITLFVVLMMIYSLFDSARNVLLIMLNIPFALVGGIFALTFFGENVSIPSSIGFIALFGIALTDGLVLISRFEHLKSQGMALRDLVISGSLSKLRPVLMTSVTTALGLLPLIMATGTGSEVQRPLAIVVVGGLASSTLLTLIVLPVLYLHFGAGRPAFARESSGTSGNVERRLDMG